MTLELPQELAEAASIAAAREGRTVADWIAALVREKTQSGVEREDSDAVSEAWAKHEEIRQHNEELRQRMANLDPNRKVSPQEHAARMKLFGAFGKSDEDREDGRKIMERIDAEFGKIDPLE